MYELRNKVIGLLRLLLRLLVLGISLCLASAGAVQAQPAVMTTEDLGTLFDQHALREMKKSNIAGAAIVVVKDGAVVFMRGYGYADVAGRHAALERQVPASGVFAGAAHHVQWRS